MFLKAGFDYFTARQKRCHMNEKFKAMGNRYKVLWFHPAAAVGGASISLIELLKPLLSNQVEGLVITPEGSAAKRFREQGLNVLAVRGLSQWDNTRFSRYKGLRWLILLRELALLPGSLHLLCMLRNRCSEFDLIHLNEITLLPLGILAKRLLNLPLVVHIRSLQSTDAGGIRSRLIKWMLINQADSVIAIDESVRRTLPSELSVEIVHNVLQVDGSHLRDETDYKKQRFRTAIVGGLLVLKGVYEFIEAAKICEQRGLDIEFIIAGENVRELKGLKGRLIKAFGFGRDVRADLERMIVNYGLEGVVKIKGFVSQIGELYSSIDLLCFPSYLDATGRPVFEAAFFGVPSIVAVNNPPPDSLIPNVTGICIAAPEPKALADAIERMYSNRDMCRYMGQAAKKLAEENYTPALNSQRLWAIYKKVTK